MTLKDITNCISRLFQEMKGIPAVFSVFVIILAFLAILFIIFQKKPIKINRVLGSIGVTLAAVTLVFSILSVNAGILYIKTDGSPSSTVNFFYSQLIAGNFTDSYKLLKDYTTLGLENTPDDKYAARLYDSLKSSYSYELIGDASINEFSAVQRVRFSYMDTSLIKDKIAAEIDLLLQKKVDTLSRKELYDAKGNYLPELLDAVYDEAFNKVLADTSDFLTSIEYDVELEYVGSRWLIIINDDMIKGLGGAV